MRLSEQEYADLMKRRCRCIPIPIKLEPSVPVQGSKFNNVICEADRIKFPSKKHRAHYLLLKAMQQEGEIKFFLREVPFDLPGQYDNGRVIRHYVDFMLCQIDGTYRYQEVKGRDLALGKLKRKQVEDIYNIKIEVI